MYDTTSTRNKCFPSQTLGKLRFFGTGWLHFPWPTITALQSEFWLTADPGGRQLVLEAGLDNSYWLIENVSENVFCLEKKKNGDDQDFEPPTQKKLPGTWAVLGKYVSSRTTNQQNNKPQYTVLQTLFSQLSAQKETHLAINQSININGCQQVGEQIESQYHSFLKITIKLDPVPERSLSSLQMC